MTVTRQMPSTHQTPSTPPTRVVLVDDHPLFRRGLAELLSEGGLFEVVADFDDGSDLLETLPTLAPELVIVDWQMPQLDGLTLMRHLKQHDATLKVVLLTASDDSLHLLDAIQQGADGYLMKDTDPERILERLQAVVDGKLGLEEETLLLLARRLQQDHRQRERHSQAPTHTHQQEHEQEQEQTEALPAAANPSAGATRGVSDSGDDHAAGLLTRSDHCSLELLFTGTGVRRGCTNDLLAAGGGTTGGGAPSAFS